MRRLGRRLANGEFVSLLYIAVCCMKIVFELTILFDRPARAGGKRKRAPFTSDDPTYKPTWSWDPSDHSSEFMSGKSFLHCRSQQQCLTASV